MITQYSWKSYRIDLQEAFHLVSNYMTSDAKSLYDFLRTQNYSSSFITDFTLMIECQSLYSGMDTTERMLRLGMQNYNPNSKVSYLLNCVENNLNQNEVNYPLRYKLEIFINQVQEKARFLDGKITTYLPSPSHVSEFIFNCLEDLCATLTVSQTRRRDDTKLLIFFDKLKKVIDLYDLKELEIELLLAVASMQINQDSSSFDRLKELLHSQKFRISAVNLRNCYLSAINVLYIKHHEWGRSQRDILDMYMLMEKNIGSEFYSFLTVQTIKNLSTLCIRCNQKPWFDLVFSAKKTLNLGPEIQTTLRLCDAKFAFADKHYQNALDILITYKPFDIFQDLDLRRLQVMCFYELKERVLVDNYLNSFKVFVHRNHEIVDRTKDSNNNFIRILNRLNKSIDLKKTEAILAEVQTLSHCSEKKWLEDKCRELMDKLNLGS